MGLFDAIGNIVTLPVQVNQARINRQQQNANIDKQNAANKEMADMEFNKNVEMWNMQNQYNSPESQMSRFEKAGLNKNMIYGQGNPGNASQLPKYSAPNVNKNYAPMDLTNVIGQYQDFRVKAAQIDNLKAQRRILDAEGTIKESKAFYSNILEASKAGLSRTQMMDMENKQIWSTAERQAMFYFNSVDSKYYVKPEMKGTFSTMLSTKWMSKTVELGKTQSEIRNLNLLGDLREKEKEFLNTGGKYFAPLMQFLKLMSGR